MISKTEGLQTTQFGWDYENRLKTVTRLASPDVSYKYDALGRRIERTKSVSIPVPVILETTRFVYDGTDVVRDLDGNGATMADYLNGPGIDNKLRQTVGATTSYFLADHLGTTRALTNPSGAVTSSLSYDSYGNVTSGSVPTRYIYSGREIDSDTSLMYYRARWYDSKQGRFVSEDPIGFEGGDMNLYSYVLDNPLNGTDPEGTQVRSAERNRPGDKEWADGLRRQMANWDRGCGCRTDNQDVRNIRRIFNDSVYRMTTSGQRHPDPYWNNFWSTFGASYVGCGLQVDIVTGDLERNRFRYQSNWKFETQSGFTPLFHQWGVATSDNPKDPVITYDPWHDNFQVSCRCKR